MKYVEIVKSVKFVSGNTFYHMEEEQSNDRHGFLINNRMAHNITMFKSILTRVICIILKITKSYKMKLIQVYAATTKYTKDEFYEKISRAINEIS